MADYNRNSLGVNVIQQTPSQEMNIQVGLTGSISLSLNHNMKNGRLQVHSPKEWLECMEESGIDLI